MSTLKQKLTDDLQAEFSAHNIAVTDQEIPEVLRIGADAFLTKRDAAIPEKKLTGFYLILSELRALPISNLLNQL